MPWTVTVLLPLYPRWAFGNQKGVKIEHNVDERDLFSPGFGDIICEVADGKVGELAITYTVIGEVTDSALPGIQGYEDHDGGGSGDLESASGESL